MRSLPMRLFLFSICCAAALAGTLDEIPDFLNVTELDIGDLGSATQVLGNDFILCRNVEVACGYSSDDNETSGPFIDWHYVTCEVEEEGVVELTNLWPTFQTEWGKAVSQGSGNLPGLQIFGGSVSVNSGRIEIPSPGSYSYFWQVASSSSSSSLARDLTATPDVDKTTGNKSILVYRITVEKDAGRTEPTNTAAEVSAKIFGSLGQTGVVTMKQQFLDCSNGQITFDPATAAAVGLEENDLSAPGVIDLTVDIRNTLIVMDATGTNGLDAAAKAAATLLGVDHTAYDYTIYLLPNGALFNGDTSWVAFATIGGWRSWFNDDKIMDLENLMHELGHNLGLDHSSQKNDPTSEEYGDTTGYMGARGSDNLNEKKCYNGANGFKLGWYNSSPNRVRSVQYSEGFTGKLISVDDYADSTSDHTLILEIRPPAPNAPLYLTYNKVKGMNSHTGEAHNEVTVIEGRPNEKSYLKASIGNSGTYTIDNYHFNQDLVIQVGQPGQDNMVDFVPLTVTLEADQCASTTDCTVSAGSPECVNPTCSEFNVCDYPFTPSCCGDGYCDTSENCSTCPEDCTSEYCSYFSIPAISAFGQFYDTVVGAFIEIEALQDLSFYEIQMVVKNDQTSPVPLARVFELIDYSYVTPIYLDYPTLTATSSPGFSMATIALPQQKYIAQGSKRLFYVEFVERVSFLWASAAHSSLSNQDLKVNRIQLMHEELFNLYHESVGHFVGGLKYTLTSTQSSTIPPTPGPTSQPTPSPVPEASISKLFSMSLNTPAGVCFLNASQQSLLCSTWTQEASTQEYVSSTCVIISQTSSKPSCNTSTRQLDGGSSRNLEEGTVTVEMSVTMTSTNPTVDETDLATVSSSVLQSFTADVPTALESAGLPTSFSTLPEDVEAADESGGSTAANESGGSTGGDPHFQTFNGNYFSYHGQCDLVLVDNPGFASGLGLLLHIRTTRVEKKKIKYSYISGVALKVGKDVLEVFADGSFLVNGSSGDIHETKELSGYTLVQKLQGTKKNIFVYDLNLGSKNHHIQIRANTKTGMLFVDVSGSFPGSVGLLGSTEKKGLMARDNTTDLRGYWNAFGEQWQVLSSEPKLFQENRAPQHPNGCVYNSEAMTSSLRRRLIDNSSDGVTLEVATEACSTITGPKKSFCVEDVIATGSVELAEDPFYND